MHFFRNILCLTRYYPSVGPHFIKSLSQFLVRNCFLISLFGGLREDPGLCRQSLVFGVSQSLSGIVIFSDFRAERIKKSLLQLLLSRSRGAATLKLTFWVQESSRGHTVQRGALLSQSLVPGQLCHPRAVWWCHVRLPLWVSDLQRLSQSRRSTILISAIPVHFHLFLVNF